MPDYFYVYPGYLSEESTRREGRRVPAPLALKDVTAEEIATAAKKLGYAVELQANKQYPRQFYRYAGRVKLSKNAGGRKKTDVLRLLVAEIRRARPAGAPPHHGGHK